MFDVWNKNTSLDIETTIKRLDKTEHWLIDNPVMDHEENDFTTLPYVALCV